jgi:phage baseplate assembly protein W
LYPYEQTAALEVALRAWQARVTLRAWQARVTLRAWQARVTLRVASAGDVARGKRG